MKNGFTTGSCAAAAAKAAAYMLLTGKEKKEISVLTPKGIVYHAQLEHIERTKKGVSCCVRKDGGDDPDVTSGMFIGASVSVIRKETGKGRPEICIEGGPGVGRITKPGLEQPVGSPAINRVPREMIEREVCTVCELSGFQGTLFVEIFVPDGGKLAQKTFNPRLGITGGISILGTTGIVEPMSSQAVLDTIRAELSVRKASGYLTAAVSPGNYGQDFMKNTYGYDLEKSIKCSNYIGETIDMAAGLGFREMLLTGHIGKLVKLAGGSMNTHSKEGDCRLELLAAAGIRAGITARTAREILACITTEEALKALEREGKRTEAMEWVMERACFYLNRRAAGRLRIECIMYANGLGELAKSKDADVILDGLVKER